MAENEEPERTSTQPSNSRPPSPARPTITLPPRTTFEALFNGGGGFSGSGGGFSGTGFSPGPMTLVSSFFSDAGDDCKSFSQLLAGALTSPPPPAAVRPTLPVSDGVGDADFLLQSPGIFSSGQGPFGMTMTHQQVLAQVTAQAAQANLKVQTETEYLSSLSSSPATSLAQLQAFSPTSAALQEMPSLVPASATSIAVEESSDASHQDLNSQPSADKPNDDGYNWRKYGQKHVKGSEFPRSYYKCTHPNCPVKKKVERSLHGQVTEIIYKGEHNHLPPQTNKRGKDVGNSNGNPNSQSNHDLASQVQSGHFNKSKERTTSYSLSRKDQESSQATHEQTSGTSDSEEVREAEVGLEENDEDEPEPKRQSMGVRHSEPASSHRTVTEPRIIVQTTSEVDLLDDGYRWRKYGQKVVKGNPYPRSYYKCTTPGCNVRKHVERASTDPKAVITTYEGKHNHDVPAGKSSSHNTANFNASNLNNKMDLRNNSQRPVGRLRLEEEQIT